MSHIIITCAANANPKYNRLQLRTEPPTYIELQPGENVLDVKQYPALRYGFSQINDIDDIDDDNKNCQDIIKIDLSNFDGKEMVSMDCMFGCMSPKELIFGNLDTSKVESMCDAFWRFAENNPEFDIDLSGLDLSNVKDTTMMFFGCGARSLNLSGCDLHNVERYDDMFGSVCSFEKIILDNCKAEDIAKFFEDSELQADDVTMSLRGLDWRDAALIIYYVTYFKGQIFTQSSATFITDRTTVKYEFPYAGPEEYSSIKRRESETASIKNSQVLTEESNDSIDSDDWDDIYADINEHKDAYNDSMMRHPHPGILEVKDYAPKTEPMDFGNLCKSLSEIHSDPFLEVYMYNLSEKRFYHCGTIYGCQCSILQDRAVMEFLSSDYTKVVSEVVGFTNMNSNYTKSAFEFGIKNISKMDIEQIAKDDIDFSFNIPTARHPHYISLQSPILLNTQNGIKDLSDVILFNHGGTSFAALVYYV